MRKITRLLVAAVLLLQGMYATAQDKTISGTVTDADDNSPVPGVSITIKGSNRGTITNARGIFSIKAQKGEMLIISSMGYEGRQVRVGQATTISVKIKNAETQVGAVVTAMTGKRNPRELGCSVQV